MKVKLTKNIYNQDVTILKLLGFPVTKKILMMGLVFIGPAVGVYKLLKITAFDSVTSFSVSLGVFILGIILANDRMEGASTKLIVKSIIRESNKVLFYKEGIEGDD